MMHLLLFVLCLIVGLTSTVDGSCFMIPPKEDSLDCIYKGRIIKDDKSYTEKCISCSCSKGNMQCCSIGMRISSKPADCKVVPDGPCSQKVVLISDENKPCPGGFSMVGR